jgi:dynactin 1
VDIPPPWLARVASIKEATSHNIDTERKVVRMSEELKDLLREVKIRVSRLQLLVDMQALMSGSNTTRIRSQG